MNLRHLHEPAIRPELQDKEHLLSASIIVDDAKPIFLEFQAASVAFHQTLKTEPWDARTFIIRDPDGNLILFAGQGQESQRSAEPASGFSETYFKADFRRCPPCLEKLTAIHRRRLASRMEGS